MAKALTPHAHIRTQNISTLLEALKIEDRIKN
jgi:hypothetical protein